MRLRVFDKAFLVSSIGLAPLLWFAVLVLACSALGAERSDRPNVILILIDDMGWSDLGCTGSSFYQTPNIDRLAAEGMKFTDAYAACPVCSPTRASLMTGKHPARLNLTDWLPGRRDMPSQKLNRPSIEPALPLSETTVAELLKRAGYITASIGKWHLGGKGFEPQLQGFDLNVAGDHTGTPASYFYPYTNRFVRMPGLQSGEPGEYLTDRLTTEAVQFIEENKDRPFFVYLPHYAVHIPMRARADLIERYRGMEPGRHHTNAIYAAMIESVDQSVARILETLERLELSRNTVVIFTSDNGGLSVKEGPNTPATSNAPLRAGKGYLYEGGVRVPLIVRWPGVVAPRAISEIPVISTDLFATILAIAKVPASEPRDGTSLMPILKGESRSGGRPLYWHYPHYSNQGGRPGGAVREGPHKLIEFYEDGRLELYDLEADPAEQVNLANQLPELRERLRRRLAAWRQSVGARMPTLNPAYDASNDRLPDYVIRPVTDDEVQLHARDANAHGSMVRYEPQPHKNTIGYWVNPEDWVSWDFLVVRPGEYRVEMLQGCGPGNGGSEVALTTANQTLTFRVVETSGFQDFLRREIGTIRFPEVGRYSLAVRPKNKAGHAIMDLRLVTLRHVSEADGE